MLRDKNGKRQLVTKGAVEEILSSAVGVTMSMLTYTPVQKANIFTFSDVSIRLTEEEWDALDNDPYGKILYPGRTVSKDPKIENTGRNDLYAYLEVTVPRSKIRIVGADETIGTAATAELFSYIPDTANWLELTDCQREDSDKIIRIYAYKKPLKAGQKTSALFESITFVNMLEGEIEMGTELTVDINAYAIQTEALDLEGDTDEEKVKEAFEKYKLQEAADEE